MECATDGSVYYLFSYIQYLLECVMEVDYNRHRRRTVTCTRSYFTGGNIHILSDARRPSC